MFNSFIHAPGTSAWWDKVAGPDKATLMRSPSDVGLMGDHEGVLMYDAIFYDKYLDGTENPSNEYETSFFRHPAEKGVNLLYGDSHVNSLTTSSLRGSMNPSQMFYYGYE